MDFCGGTAQPPADELTRALLSNDAPADFYTSRPCVTPASALPGAPKFRPVYVVTRGVGTQEFFAALETWIKRQTHVSKPLARTAGAKILQMNSNLTW